MLLADAVRSLAPLGLEGLNDVAGLFIAPAMNPRTVCLCQLMVVVISSIVAPFLRWSIATTCAVLLPSRGAAASSVFAAFLGSFIFLTGFSPGRLFRTANRRSAGQAAANSDSSCSLAKMSNGVCVAADASSVVENATISFCSFDRKRRHCESPLFRALRGQHTNHSEVPGSKGLLEINLQGQRIRDGRLSRAEMTPR